jgi:hypothetical protein
MKPAGKSYRDYHAAFALFTIERCTTEGINTMSPATGNSIAIAARSGDLAVNIGLRVSGTLSWPSAPFFSRRLPACANCFTIGRRPQTHNKLDFEPLSGMIHLAGEIE